MDPTKKRLRSPGAGNDRPPKRTKISTQARAVLPRKRRRGLKDDRLIALQNLEYKRRCPVFGIDPSEIDALKHRKLTNGIPTLESQQPHQHSALLAGPLSPPTDDYIEINGDINDPSVRPDTSFQSSSHTTAGGLRNDRTVLRQLAHLDRTSSTWNTSRNIQAAQWKSVVIPQLVTAYLANRAETESGRLPPSPKPPHQCKCARVELKVELIAWDRYSQRTLSICTCYSAAIQLAELGYFPCAPVRPSLAVDINLLEFVTIASHNMAPNVKGWSDTLQSFLAVRGFLLGEKDVLRRRFGNALHWYQSLTATANNEVDAWVRNVTFTTSTLTPENSAEIGTMEIVTTEGTMGGKIQPRGVTVEEIEDEDRSCLPPFPRSDANATGPWRNCLETAQADGEPDESQLGMPVLQAPPFPIPRDFPRVNENTPSTISPSLHLQRRCPICFSAGKPNLPNSVPQVIVCIDANFAQRRRHSRHPDPEDPHPDSHFLTVKEVDTMRQVVERARPSEARAGTGTAALPDDTLDDCEKAFIAAQSHIAKTNNVIFADTALMALLCRHDRPLFLVNMTSAGERQYYALALIKALYQHLPDDWVVGLLYDVACQLERSMRKHSFLPEYIDRLVFAVSVFHAFGHQWACQLIYHPRKCKGFGLSDGEGCERLWSALRKMIPSLRSAGYWRRLFALDSHLKWFGENNLPELGRWAQRKRCSALARREDATIRLEESGVPQGELEREWKSQVDAQLCSAPRQHKNTADRIITGVLEKQVALKKVNQRHMRAIGRKGRTGTADKALTAEIKSCEEIITSLKETIEAQMSDLGFTQAPKGGLRKFKGDSFLRLRMNALSLRDRILQNLVARKFEMEKLERLVNCGSQMAHQDHTHIKQALNRRKGSHTRLVKSYEKLRQEMEEMVSQGTTPVNIKIPASLANAKLWDLDVDDEIWMEIAQDAHFQDKGMPKWLCDIPTQRGIRAMLEVQRCNEELERLDHERDGMYSWLRAQEDQLYLAGCIAQGDLPLLYQIEQRKANLGRVSCAWGMKIVIRSNIHLDTPLHPEDSPITSRSSSPVSTDSQHEGEYMEEVWEELETALRTQEARFMAEEYIIEDVPLNRLGLTSDNLDMSRTQTPAPQIPPHQPQLAVPAFWRESPSPTIPSSSGVLDPVSPVWPPDPDIQSEYCASPSRSQAALPSKQAEGDGSSTGNEITRESPTGRFLACEDQIRALIDRGAWVHGAVINTIGDFFCYGSRSQCRLRRYEILPTWLFEWWKSPRKDEAAAQKYRRGYSDCFKQAASPVECRAWLVPILHNEHWYLLALDWEDSRIRIYDSLAMGNEPPSQLVAFGRTLVSFAHEDFNLEDKEWFIIPELRGCRQKNGVDCGVYVLWDIYNLSKYGELRTQSPPMMSDWRSILHHHIRALSPYKKRPRSEQKTSTEPVIDLDSD